MSGIDEPSDEPVWVEPGPSRAGADIRGSSAQVHNLVVVGAACSGKSRLLSEVASRVPSEWQLMQPPSTPRTDVWRRLSRPTIDVSHWENVWRILIVGSYLSFANVHQHLLDEEDRQRLRSVMTTLPLGDPHSVRHPYTVMTELSSGLRSASGSELTNGKEADWLRAERVTGDLAPLLPPVVIIIDHLDNYFDNHPSEMAEVQGGLVALIAHNDRQRWIPRNVRLLAAVRRSTLDFLRKNGVPNLSTAACIKEIVWDLGSLERLFLQRLRGSDGRPRTMRWLVRPVGQDGQVRSSAQRRIDQLLQHTSLVAGDVDKLAGVLCEKRDFVGRQLTADEFEEGISSTAIDILNALAHNTVSDLRSLSVSRGFARHQSVQSKDEQDQLRRQLITSISAMDKDTFTPSEAARMLEAFSDNLRFLILEALWRSRLVARVEGNRWLYSRTYSDRLGPAWTLAGWNPVLAEECKLTPTWEEISVGYV